jgi:hypothetical protein
LGDERWDRLFRIDKLVLTFFLSIRKDLDIRNLNNTGLYKVKTGRLQIEDDQWFLS